MQISQVLKDVFAEDILRDTVKLSYVRSWIDYYALRGRPIPSVWKKKEAELLAKLSPGRATKDTT